VLNGFAVVAISSILDYTGNYCVHYCIAAPLQNYCGCLRHYVQIFPWRLKFPVVCLTLVTRWFQTEQILWWVEENLLFLYGK